MVSDKYVSYVSIHDNDGFVWQGAFTNRPTKERLIAAVADSYPACELAPLVRDTDDAGVQDIYFIGAKVGSYHLRPAKLYE